MPSHGGWSNTNSLQDSCVSFWTHLEKWLHFSLWGPALAFPFHSLSALARMSHFQPLCGGILSWRTELLGGLLLRWLKSCCLLHWSQNLWKLASLLGLWQSTLGMSPGTLLELLDIYPGAAFLSHVTYFDQTQSVLQRGCTSPYFYQQQTKSISLPMVSIT